MSVLCLITYYAAFSLSSSPQHTCCLYFLFYQLLLSTPQKAFTPVNSIDFLCQMLRMTTQLPYLVDLFQSWCQGLIGHMWLVATVLDRAHLEHFRNHSKFYLTVLLYSWRHWNCGSITWWGKSGDVTGNQKYSWIILKI